MPEPGDIIIFQREIIKHYAVFVGNGKVVDFTDDSSIREQDFETVRNGCQYTIDSGKSPFSKEKIVERARSKVGYKKFGEYNVATNNCEHFARWCRYDKKISKQVAAVGAVGGAIAVSVAGSVAESFQ